MLFEEKELDIWNGNISRTFKISKGLCRGKFRIVSDICSVPCYELGLRGHSGDLYFLAASSL